MNTFEPLPARLLVRVAHHDRPDDAPGVACILSLLSIANQLQAGLRRRFEPMGLNDHKFAALMVLYSFDPLPTTAADLAFHAQLSRPTTSDLLGQLDAASWVMRTRDPHDRRTVFVRLTKQGRAIARSALQEALRILAELGRGIDAAAQTAVSHACGILRENIQDVLEAPDSLSPSVP